MDLKQLLTVLAACACSACFYPHAAAAQEEQSAQAADPGRCLPEMQAMEQFQRWTATYCVPDNTGNAAERANAREHGVTRYVCNTSAYGYRLWVRPIGNPDADSESGNATSAEALWFVNGELAGQYVCSCIVGCLANYQVTQ